MSLSTDFSKNMNAEHPHAYYPRPSMVRDSYLSLNGVWDFGTATDGLPRAALEEKITVPFPPESALSGIEREIKPDEYMHYMRKFTLPEGFVRGRVLLHFGAVDQTVCVYLNGREAGSHEGGYTPFTLDITELLAEGENTLYAVARDGLSMDYPYGKQTKHRGGMWYTPVSGIWQSVWLESVPECYIDSFRIDTDTARVKIRVFGGEDKKTLTLDSGERFEFFGECFEFSPPLCELWTPESPNLYYFTLSSGEDSVRGYFALREVKTEVRDGVSRLTLNGKPYLFNGLLDQGYYPDGIFLPATEEGYAYDISTAKRLGFNMLIKHIKTEPDIFYHLCDKMGIFVFQDMINNSDYSFLRDTALPTVGIQQLNDENMHKSSRAREIFERTMLEVAQYTHNFPSVVCYTIFNEGWGQFCSDRMYEILKKKEPSRLIDSTSGWFRRKMSDFDSRHIYFKKLKVKNRSEKPLFLSEFGGYSHRVAGHLFGEKNYGYKTFPKREDFEEAFLSLYENEVIPLVKSGASALVYTQISDVEDETNGLLTYDRRVLKLDEEKCRILMERVKSIVGE